MFRSYCQYFNDSLDNQPIKWYNFKMNDFLLNLIPSNSTELKQNPYQFSATNQIHAKLMF